MRKVKALLLFWTISIFLWAHLSAQESVKPQFAMPKGDIADGKYGPYDANSFDLWKAKSTKPTPLVVYIHGGGLAKGDKSGISVNQLNEMLEAGLTVMAINYRLT